MERQTCDTCSKDVGTESYDFLVSITTYGDDGDVCESLHEVTGDTYLVVCPKCYQRYVKKHWANFANKVRTGQFRFVVPKT